MRMVKTRDFLYLVVVIGVLAVVCSIQWSKRSPKRTSKRESGKPVQNMNIGDRWSANQAQQDDYDYYELSTTARTSEDIGNTLSTPFDEDGVINNDVINSDDTYDYEEDEMDYEEEILEEQERKAAITKMEDAKKESKIQKPAVSDSKKAISNQRQKKMEVRAVTPSAMEHEIKVTSPLEMKRLHRMISKTALISGDIYSSDPWVVHVAIFADQTSFPALVTLANSIRRNTKAQVSFHFVTPIEDKDILKDWLSEEALSTVVYEIVFFPPEWKLGRKGMEHASYRVADVLTYLRNTKVIVLDPRCLVVGDIADLYNITMSREHWGAMPDLCSQEPAPGIPQMWYKQYLNYSRPEVRILRLPPTTCAPATAVQVANLTMLRINRVRSNLAKYAHLADRWPLFFRGVEGVSESLGPYSAVFYNHTAPIPSVWYTRVHDTSTPPAGQVKLYHWVGKDKPWEGKSQVAKLWRRYFVNDPWGDYDITAEQA